MSQMLIQRDVFFTPYTTSCSQVFSLFSLVHTTAHNYSCVLFVDVFSLFTLRAEILLLCQVEPVTIKGQAKAIQLFREE